MYIAMWSGPRNLSTAMLYAFGARDDCAIWDEPFYAAYLEATGLKHPLRSCILAACETDAAVIARRCVNAIPEGKPHFYQKHMAQHMLPQFDRTWLRRVTNVFLIRHPARVLASYHAKRENPQLQDIGLREQAELFDEVCQQLSRPPVVIDSTAIRCNPEHSLRKLCRAINIDFQPAMLSWSKGGHKDDGPWAPHWYAAIWNSTGFAGPEAALPVLQDDLQRVLQQALPLYEKLAKFKLDCGNSGNNQLTQGD